MSTELLTKLGLRLLFGLVSILYLPRAGAQDTIQRSVPDTLAMQKNDTTLVKKDSVNYGISPDAIKSRIDYSAKDSIRFEISSQQVYLYKDDDISYEDINIKADYIEINFNNSTLTAKGMVDSLGNDTGLPVFTRGENSFTSKQMKYNYDTQKGLVETVLTQDGDMYLHGTTIKKLPNNIMNIYQGKFTTCNLEHPHYEFRFKKAKVIPDDKIITGPAYFVVEDVPTPIGVPFGMFPNNSGQRSGIIIPTWGESAQRGFYLENGGYYWAINDYMDFTIKGDIYSLGSWAIKPSMNYRKRYKYNGYFNANYAINILGEEGSPDYSRNRDFSVRWIHNQDAKARPGSNFSANVNIVSSQYNKFNPVNSNAYLSNTFQSSINYSKSWGGKYFLNLGGNLSQNTITKELNLTLPSLTFSVNRFYPFRKKIQIGKPKWYENISVNYNMAAQNLVNTYDSLFFENNIYGKMKNGIKNSVQLSSGSIKLAKFIVWTNSFNYTERWYSQKQVKSWNNDTIIINGEPVTGYVGVDTIPGFNAVRDFNFTASLSTTMYGMYAFKGGPVNAIRHVLKPSVSFTWHPDFSAPEWGYYNYYINESGNIQRYSYYDGFIYGTAPAGKSGNVSFRLSNNLQMKVRSRKDTITGTKKITLIDDLSIATSYNLAKDSLNLSPLTITGYTTIFKKLNIRFGSSFDPYALDEKGRRINKFEWNVNRRLFRPEMFKWTVGLNYSFSSNKKSKKEIKPNSASEQEIEDLKQNMEGYVDWDIPWSFRFGYNLNYTTTYKYYNGYTDYEIDKVRTLVQTLSFSGDVNITPKWKVGFRSGYDFENNEFTYTSIDVYRDLHCWEMRFNWIPYGFRQSWNFSINIKSSLLQDLKLDKKKDFRDY